MSILIHVDGISYQALLDHLLPPSPESEEAAFLFAQVRGAELHVGDMYLVPPEQFERRTMGHLWLKDDVYAQVIKEAHDRHAALIEAHSHPYGHERAACFSYTDRTGLRQTAPHVLWRLPDRPFVSLVFAEPAFDGLVWHGRDTAPTTVGGLLVEGDLHLPTGFSLDAWGDHGQF